jgi:hypothetical protein
MPRKSAGSGTASRKKTSPSTEPPGVRVVSEVRKNLKPFNLEDEIRVRAYEIYMERRGRPGSESEDWLNAEKEVLGRYQAWTA